MAKGLPILPLLLAYLLLTAASAWAQLDPRLAPGPKRVDLSGSAGFLVSSDWSDLVLLGSVSPSGGALEQLLVRDVVVDPGAVFDATVTYWEGRFGFRAHGGFARSCLAVGARCGRPAALLGANNSIGLDAYMYDIGGAIGLREYQPSAWVWPYVFFGWGGVTYRLDERVSPPLTFIERRRAADGAPVVVRDRSDQLVVAIDELETESQLGLNVGVGADLRVPLGSAGLGVRFEASDNIHRSPLAVRVVDVERVSASGSEHRLDFGPVHNLRVAAGVVVQLGR